MEQQQRGILLGDPANYGVYQAAFSPDGKLLTAGYGDGYVRLWNLVTGQAVGAPLLVDTRPGGTVIGVAFSPDGTLLATADTEGHVRLWDLATRHAVGAPLVSRCRTDTSGTGNMIA